jgi:hypothetical protein
MTLDQWWTLPPGPERKAAERAAHRRDEERMARAKPPPLESLKRVESAGSPAWQGPSKVLHTFANEAEEEIAKRLARTFSPVFPRDLLTAEIRDGQLILGCRSRDYRFPVPLDLDVPPFIFAATIDHLRDAESEHRAAQPPNPGNQKESNEL